MKLYADQLSRHLEKTLPPALVLSSNDPFLQQEAGDAVRAAARKQGFTERDVFEVDRHFNWQQVIDATQEMSLFGDRKLIELRLGDARPDAKTAELLENYGKNPSPDHVLLFLCSQLDAREQKARWFSAVDAFGVSCIQYSINREQLPAWLRSRLTLAQLSLPAEAIDFLADHVEGNLLAAAQEVEKLRLYYGQGALTLEQVTTVVADSARFDPFVLVDALLAGDTVRGLRILQSLREEGTEPPQLLWALTRELRSLEQMSFARDQGSPLQRVLEAHHVWKNRMRLVGTALQRLDTQTLQRLLALAAEIDQAAKGRHEGDAWVGLRSLCARLTGQPAPLSF